MLLEDLKILSTPNQVHQYKLMNWENGMQLQLQSFIKSEFRIEDPFYSLFDLERARFLCPSMYWYIWGLPEIEHAALSVKQSI